MVCQNFYEDVFPEVAQSILEEVLWDDFREFAEGYWISKEVYFDLDHYKQMSDEEFETSYDEDKFEHHCFLIEEAVQKFLQTEKGKLIRLFALREQRRTAIATEWSVDLCSRNRKLRTEVLKYLSEDQLERVLSDQSTDNELALLDEKMGTPLNVVE